MTARLTGVYDGGMCVASISVAFEPSLKNNNKIPEIENGTLAVPLLQALQSPDWT